MKIRLSQFFSVLSQPKLYAHFKFLFSLMFFKETIIILYFMYCFWRNTPTYLDIDKIHLYAKDPYEAKYQFLINNEKAQD